MNHQELLEDVLTKLVLGRHALDCAIDNFLGILFQQLPHRVLFQAGEVLGVVSVKFEVTFAPSHMQVLRINNHTDVALISKFGVVGRLVLPPNENGAHARHPAQRNSGCIEKVVSLALMLNGHVARLRFFLRHGTVEAAPDQVWVHFVHPQSQVRVELHLGELLFGCPVIHLGAHPLFPLVWRRVVFFVGAFPVKRVEFKVFPFFEVSCE